MIITIIIDTFFITILIIRNIIGNMQLCLNTSNEDFKNQFHMCYRVIYIPTNKSYQRFECYGGYYLNYTNNTCLRNIEDNEPEKNCIVDKNASVYSCQSCYNSDQTLVTFETGIKECIYDNLLENCIEAIIQLMYIFYIIVLLAVLIIYLIIINFMEDKFVKIFMNQ